MLRISERLNFNSITPGSSQSHIITTDRVIDHGSNNSYVQANVKNLLAKNLR